MTTTSELSTTSRAALDAAGFSHVSDNGAAVEVASWLSDAIVENYRNYKANPTLALEWSEGWSASIEDVLIAYSAGPGAEDLWSEIWNDDFKKLVADELDAGMQSEIRDDFYDRIGSAANLDLLVRLLKAADAWANDADMDIEEVYDATELPTFGGAAIDDAGVFSWDDSRVLRHGAGDSDHAWQITPRSEFARAA